VSDKCKRLSEGAAISQLQTLARKWPETLWLFSASGTLNVMRTDHNGKQATLPGGGVDPAFSVAVVRIPNDGGDW